MKCSKINFGLLPKRPCDRLKTIILVDGEAVCDYCPAHALECEARHLLGYSLSKRRLALKERLPHRGEKGVQNLKDVMMELWDARKR